MRAVRLLTILTFTSALMARTAFGQIAFSFDENGNATGPGTTPGVIAVEPISGISTLSYALPFAVAPGDVLLFENQGQLSDIVRFETINQSGFLFFFSDREEGETSPDLADVVALPTPLEGAVSLAEVGPEGANGAVWSPTPSGPPGAPIVTYTLISDVPEPSSWLLALGGALLLTLRRRRLGK